MESKNGGCGCLTIIIGFLLFWFICFGIPVGEKTWNLDILPPRIWDASTTN